MPVPTLTGQFSTYPVPLAPEVPERCPPVPASTAQVPQTTEQGPRSPSMSSSSSASSSLRELKPLSGESSKRYPYFTHGDLSSTRSVVFIGGLTNGMGDVPYLPRLGEKLGQVGWKLVQMHWSGAYEGYGTGSLDRDVLEMRALVKHLRENGDTHIVIMGHSTGSQDVMHYLTSSAIPSESRVQGGIMQAPASDHELYVKIDSNDPGWAAAIQEAQGMMSAGRGREVLSPESCRVLKMRMTAYRAWSLHDPNGDDDYFSRHIPSYPDGKHPHPLSHTFGQLPVPALAIYSAKDEHIQLGAPGPLIARWEEMAKEKARDLETRVIDGSHDLKEEKATEELAQVVSDWVKRFG